MEIKKQIYIIVSAFFLLAIFLVLFLVYPLSKEITQSSGELVSQINSRLALKSQYDQALNFKQKYESYQQNLNKADDLFIDPQNPVDFIEFLEKEAQNQGLDFLISSVKEASDKKSLRVITVFQAALGGSFPECLTFLKRLEQSPWLIKIDQVGLDRISEKNKLLSFKDLREGDVVLNLNFKTFSRYLTSVVK